MGGCHSCDFCGKALGFGSFGVPAGDKLYYAPDMIAHYVEQHDYDPPAEFIAAVRDGDILIPRLTSVEPLREELAHFVTCINTGNRPITSGEDGVAVVRVLEAASRSLLDSQSRRLTPS